MYNLTVNATNPGLDTILQGINTAVPGFTNLLLIFEFILIAFAGTYAAKRAVGTTQFLQWATFSAWVTTISAGILYLIPGIIPLTSLSICLIASATLSLVYFFSGKDDE